MQATKKRKPKNLAKKAGHTRGALKRKGIKAMNDGDMEVPIDYIPDKDMVAHKIVTDIVEHAQEVHEELRKLKEHIYESFDQHAADILNRDPEKAISYTLRSFDKEYKVTVKKGNKERFDELYMAEAKNLVDEYAGEHITDEGAIQLLQAGFETKNGEYDPKALNRIRKMKTNNEHIKAIQDKIEKARDYVHTKRYIEITQRDEEGKERGIVLDLASV